MNIAVIGASAGIGFQTVMQALERGYTVRALARKTASLPDHPSLIKINGSADSVQDLKAAITGTDAVLVTIGTTNKKGTKLFSETARAIITAAAELKYSGNVIIVTGFGTGESRAYLGLFMRLVINLFLKEQYKDKTLMEELIAGSSVKWEIVKPGILGDGPLTKTYKVMPELQKGIKVGKISRADVAHYLLTEAENSKNLYHYTALTA